MINSKNIDEDRLLRNISIDKKRWDNDDHREEYIKLFSAIQKYNAQSEYSIGFPVSDETIIKLDVGYNITILQTIGPLTRASSEQPVDLDVQVLFLNAKKIKEYVVRHITSLLNYEVLDWTEEVINVPFIVVNLDRVETENNLVIEVSIPLNGGVSIGGEILVEVEMGLFNQLKINKAINKDDVARQLLNDLNEIGAIHNESLFRDSKLIEKANKHVLWCEEQDIMKSKDNLYRWLLDEGVSNFESEVLAYTSGTFNLKRVGFSQEFINPKHKDTTLWLLKRLRALKIRLRAISDFVPCSINLLLINRGIWVQIVSPYILNGFTGYFSYAQMEKVETEFMRHYSEFCDNCEKFHSKFFELYKNVCSPIKEILKRIDERLDCVLSVENIDKVSIAFIKEMEDDKVVCLDSVCIINHLSDDIGFIHGERLLTFDKLKETILTPEHFRKMEAASRETQDKSEHKEKNTQCMQKEELVMKNETKTQRSYSDVVKKKREFMALDMKERIKLYILDVLRRHYELCLTNRDELVFKKKLSGILNHFWYDVVLLRHGVDKFMLEKMLKEYNLPFLNLYDDAISFNDLYSNDLLDGTQFTDECEQLIVQIIEDELIENKSSMYVPFKVDENLKFANLIEKIATDRGLVVIDMRKQGDMRICITFPELAREATYMLLSNSAFGLSEERKSE